jgi:hypothetical protein
MISGGRRRGANREPRETRDGKRYATPTRNATITSPLKTTATPKPEDFAAPHFRDGQKIGVGAPIL